MSNYNINIRFICVLIMVLINAPAMAHNTLQKTVKAVKPSIVGVGIYDPNLSPQNQLYGSGFVIGNGLYVVTNYHVVKPKEILADKAHRVIFSGRGKKGDIRSVTIEAFSEQHDLALLKIQGSALPALTLAKKSFRNDGEAIAFTGFPIGSVLGLYPATHQGIIAATTPVVIPANDAKQLTAAQIKTLKNPFMIYQLDAVAYPGNSGSPLYLQDSGEVIGIINKVFVKRTKESAISDPSGITYAIPVRYLQEMIQKENINIEYRASK
ncbi:S1 family peptidase [Thalassotalea crassostreae]|uniref:S1 family peptidase n=1 Tax=Thalassotalea crassostreae TaxID=1763536 RepID=UPI000837F39E|nr:serine protease [Thalassotalea crassostreae]